MNKHTVRGLVAAGSVALLVAGCSSSKDDDDASGGGGSKATVLIGSTAPISNPAFSQPEQRSGMEAAIKSVNAAGGINGRMLKLDFCDGKYQVNTEIACARQFIKDKVAAVVDPVALADGAGTGVKLLQKANIAWFGNQGVLPTDVSLPNSFPLASGLPGWSYGAAAALVKLGLKKISIIVDPNPGSQYAATLLDGALKSAGIKPSAIVTGDSSSDPTFSSAVAKATAGGVEGVIAFPAPVAVPKVLTALKQSGYKGKTAVVSTVLNAETAKAVGSAADGVLLSSQLRFVSDTGNPAVKRFVGDMAKYAAGAKVDDVTLNAWTAVQLFAKALAKQTDFSGPAVLKALGEVSTPIDVGTLGPWSSKGTTSPFPSAPRIGGNPTITIGVIKSGQIEPQLETFINPFEALKDAAGN